MSFNHQVLEQGVQDNRLGRGSVDTWGLGKHEVMKYMGLRRRKNEQVHPPKISGCNQARVRLSVWILVVGVDGVMRNGALWLES